MHANTRRWINRLLSFGCLFGITLGFGILSGCGAGPPVPYPEEALRVDGAIQAHITERGFESLEAAILPLISGFMGSGAGGTSISTISICLPMTEASGFLICGNGSLCADQTLGCQLDIPIDSIDLIPVNNGPGTAQAQTPDQLKVSVAITDMDEVIPIEFGFIACDLDLTLDSSAGQYMTFDILMDLDISPTTDLLDINFVEDGTSINIDDLQIDASGICAIGNLGFIQDFIKNQVNTLLTPMIVDGASSALCKTCEQNSDCPDASYCDLEAEAPTCLYSANDACVKVEFGAQGFFGFGDLLSSFSPTIGGAGLYYWLYAGNFADALAPPPEGLTLGLQTGFSSDHNDCVAYFEPPSAGPVGVATELERGITPISGDPYDLGLGISKRSLDHAMWGIYNSGALCLEIGTTNFDQLSSSTLGIFPSMRSLGRLTGGENSAMSIKLFPRRPPTISLGAGTFDESTDPPTLTEPLMTIELYDLDVEFYAFIFGRYSLIFTANVDLDLPIGLATTADNELQILLGDSDQFFQRVDVRNSELLSVDPADLEELIPSLVGSFLPLILDTLAAPIALPSFQGMELEIVETTSLHNDTFLGLFANMTYAPPPGGLSIAADTFAEVMQIETPLSAYLKNGVLSDEVTGHIAEMTPSVEVSLRAAVPAGKEDKVEYSHRLNKGFWSTFSPSDKLVIHDPTLLFEGHHTLEVRSRIAGAPRTLDPTPATADILIDWSAPMIKGVGLRDQIAVVRASDTLDGEDGLSYRFRVNRGDWSAWGPSAEFDLSEHEGQRVKLQVEAKDSAGHVASKYKGLTIYKTLSTALVVPEVVMGPAPKSSFLGCNANPAAGGNSETPWGFLILGAATAGLFLRRRKTSLAPAALALLLCTTPLMGGCDDETASIDENECPGGVCECTPGEDGCGVVDACTDDSECPEGQSCIDNNGALECVADTCTDSSECNIECAGDQVAMCFSGMCICEVPCKDGCPDGNFCCNAEDTCLPLPDFCADYTCDPGFRATLTTPGEPNSQTCDTSDPVCGCEELPPLSWGAYGIDASVTATSGRVIGSCYNRSYGDLMVGVAEGDGEMTWSFIDGIPANGVIAGSVGGPRGGNETDGLDMGKFTSIAVSDDGAVHISYQDISTHSLKYAHGTPASGISYTWDIHTVDDESNTGYWTSLKLDPSTGAPVIAYMAANAEMSNGERVSQLRLASAKNSSPNSGDWDFQTLDQVSVDGPCGTCDVGTFCRLDINQCQPEDLGPPADPTDPTSVGSVLCTTPCGLSKCFAGDVCAPVSIPPGKIGDWDYAVGVHADLTLDSTGKAIVAYHDGTRGELRIVREQGNGSFGAPVVLDGGGVARSGLWPNVLIDGAGKEHIAYVDWASRSLLYMEVESGAIEVIHDSRIYDTNGKFIGSSNIGADVAFWMDSNSELRVAHHDSTHLHLLYSRRNAANDWTHAIVAGEGRGNDYQGAFGFYVDHANVGGVDKLLNMTINMQIDDRPIQPSLQTYTAP